MYCFKPDVGSTEEDGGYEQYESSVETDEVCLRMAVHCSCNYVRPIREKLRFDKPLGSYKEDGRTLITNRYGIFTVITQKTTI
jgi:hypothetical protein